MLRSLDDSMEWMNYYSHLSLEIIFTYTQLSAAVFGELEFSGKYKKKWHEMGVIMQKHSAHCRLPDTRIVGNQSDATSVLHI